MYQLLINIFPREKNPHILDHFYLPKENQPSYKRLMEKGRGESHYVSVIWLMYQNQNDFIKREGIVQTYPKKKKKRKQKTEKRKKKKERRKKKKEKKEKRLKNRKENKEKTHILCTF